jgi:hypothetical protein
VLLQVILMSTLKEQLQSVRTQLELGKKAEESKHIISECEVIYQRLAKPQVKLRKLIADFEMLRLLPEEYVQTLTSSEEVANQSAKCRHSVESFKALWETKNYQARGDDELANAEAGLERLVESLGQAVRECWNLWVEQITSRVAVEHIKLESQKSLPGLDKVYSSYVESQDRLNGLIKRIPSEPITIDTINSLCERMVELKSKMQWDVDPEVAAFFDRLDRDPQGKVPLSLLSAKVMAWPEGQGYLDQFVIQRRGTRH